MKPAAQASETVFEEVRDILAPAVGADRAITIGEIARRTRLPRRVIEDLIETRLADFPWPLVAGARGYHRPATAAEVNDYLDSLRRRAIAIYRRRRTVIRQAAATRAWQRQGKQFVPRPAAQLELTLYPQQEPAP